MMLVKVVRLHYSNSQRPKWKLFSTRGFRQRLYRCLTTDQLAQSTAYYSARRTGDPSMDLVAVTSIG